jgi:hypothetical protein
MAAKKKITPAKKDVQPKSRLNESKKTPLTPQQVKAKKYVEKSRAAKSKSGDLAAERAVVRKVNNFNKTQKQYQEKSPSFKGVVAYVERDSETNKSKFKWDNYRIVNGKGWPFGNTTPYMEKPKKKKK